MCVCVCASLLSLSYSNDATLVKSFVCTLFGSVSLSVPKGKGVFITVSLYQDFRYARSYFLAVTVFPGLESNAIDIFINLENPEGEYAKQTLS